MRASATPSRTPALQPAASVRLFGLAALLALAGCGALAPAAPPASEAPARVEATRVEATRVEATGARAALQAGPMLGHTTHRSAVVWVQTTAPAAVEVAWRPVAQDTAGGAWRPATSGRARALATAEGDHVARFTLDGLEPGTRYAYALTLDGAPVARPYALEFTTQPLWSYRTDPPAFTVALGSCYYANDPAYDRPGTPYGGDPAIFGAIHRLDPDVMLWLGDNVYLREVDFWSPEGLAYRYRHARAEPALQPLLASAAHYATWDDHDYGPNDSDRSYILKGEALATFQRYWANPSYGLPGVPGVFTHVTWGDAEFFLLDDRYHRTPNAAPEDTRHILGEAQLTWLLDALTASRAPFKFIAVGGQILNPIPVYETFSAIAPGERQRLLEAIEARGIDGVVLLSGDRHHTELMRMERAGTYPLYEFTSSPLTAGAANPLREGSPEVENPLRVPGTIVVGQRNFGTLSFSGPRTDRTLTMRTYDPAGALLWEHAVRARDLRTPRD